VDDSAASEVLAPKIFRVRRSLVDSGSESSLLAGLAGLPGLALLVLQPLFPNGLDIGLFLLCVAAPLCFELLLVQTASEAVITRATIAERAVMLGPTGETRLAGPDAQRVSIFWLGPSSGREIKQGALAAVDLFIHLLELCGGVEVHRERFRCKRSLRH
jgi:hypothetical protein